MVHVRQENCGFQASHSEWETLSVCGSYMLGYMQYICGCIVLHACSGSYIASLYPGSFVCLREILEPGDEASYIASYAACWMVSAACAT